MANIFKNILSLPENFARSIAPRAAEASDERRQSVALANDQKEMLLNAMNEVKNAPNPQAQLEAIRKNQAILQAMDLFNMSSYQKNQLDQSQEKFSYQKGRDTALDAITNEERQYKRSRDIKSDTRADREFNYKLTQDEIDNVLDREKFGHEKSQDSVLNDITRSKFKYQQEQDKIPSSPNAFVAREMFSRGVDPLSSEGQSFVKSSQSNININNPKPLPEGLYNQVSIAREVYGITQDLIGMMKPGGIGNNMVGMWDATAQKIKKGIGLQTPDERAFEQKFVMLQRILRILNGEARMSDADFERLKPALPSKILRDPTFKRAIQELGNDNKKKLETLQTDIREFGYVDLSSIKEALGQPTQSDKTASYPSGSPNDSWTVEQLEAYIKDNE